jgi:uncharacterized coiled-coil protein SlyX
MTTPTLALWFLTLAALFASIFALSVALRSSDRSLFSRLSALSMQCKEQSATLDELSAQLKAMRQRENMRAYRDRRAGKSAEAEPDTEGDPRTWVRETNKQLALARLGVRK